MKNFKGWAVATVAMAMVGCTTTADTVTDDGGTSAAATTSGAGGSSGTTTTTGGGGPSSDDGGDAATCAPSATPSACETCAFSSCHTEICACQADADCKGALPDYFTCLAGLDGGDMMDCASNFLVAAANGAGKANELGSCINDAAACQNACSGKDGG